MATLLLLRILTYLSLCCLEYTCASSNTWVGLKYRTENGTASTNSGSVTSAYASVAPSSHRFGGPNASGSDQPPGASNNSNNDQTSVTGMMNAAIKVGSCYGCYDGGKGVLIRNPFDDYEDKTQWQVVPASFIVNDIVTPSGIYPTGWNGFLGNGNPDCPNDGTNGYIKIGPPCKKDPASLDTGPWNYAVVAYVIASEDSMKKVFKDFDRIQYNTWGWGVFYPTDSNSVDRRCFWSAKYNGYDCPGGWIPWGGTFQVDTNKKGAGSYPAGNPYADDGWGGGSGCHFGMSDHIIDQTPVDTGGGVKYLADKSCQCNYAYNNNWNDWVDAWIKHAHNRRSEDKWFNGGKSKAPGEAMDQASCWVNNLRDMIQLQNAFWFKRYDWSNQKAPQSQWDNTKPSSLRPYWGWNEVPISRQTARNNQLRDAIVIKLPAAICGKDGGHDSLSCLGKGQQHNLETDFDNWIKAGLMKTGWSAVSYRPGSYVVILREWMHNVQGFSGKDNWSKWFFCEDWTGPSKYKVVFVSGNPDPKAGPPGACYLDTQR